MLAAIDIHKAVFQAAVFDPADGAITEERFKASPERLVDWLVAWDGKLDVVALEATTGWRWVARELQSRGIEVRLTDAGQASALQGKRPKNDRLDARWLVMLLARDMLPGAWMAPEAIQRLRDRTRLRKALTDDHTRWAQRLHAILVHEGWACSRGSLLTASGRRWVAAIRLHPDARAQVEAMLTVMGSLAQQIGMIDCELRRMAKTDDRLRRCRRSSGSGRSSRRRSSPRSATRSDSVAHVRRSAPRGLTRLSGTPLTRNGEGSSPSRERLACAGRSSKQRSTPGAGAAPITSCTFVRGVTPARTQRR